jgi:hypothetical protein
MSMSERISPAHKYRSYLCVCTAILALLSAFMFTGCSTVKQAVIPQRDVSVSLVQIAEALPDWGVVRTFDQVNTRVGVTIQAVALPQFAQPSGSLSLGMIDSGLNIAQVQQRASAQLAASSQRVLGVIEQRLAVQTQQQIAAAQHESDERLRDALLANGQRVSNAYFNALIVNMQQDSSKRTNLTAQIGALTVDSLPTTGATAPDDTWGKLRDEKKAELAVLKDQLTQDKVKAAQTAGKSVGETSSRITDTQRAELAAQEESIYAEAAAVLDRARGAIQRDRLGMLTSAFESQLRGKGGQKSVLPLKMETNPQEWQVSESVPIAVGIPQNPSLIASMRDQRDSLVSSVLISVRRKALRSAKELGFHVVNWNSESPDQNATKMLVQQIISDSNNKS